VLEAYILIVSLSFIESHVSLLKAILTRLETVAVQHQRELVQIVRPL